MRGMDIAAQEILRGRAICVSVLPLFLFFGCRSGAPTSAILVSAPAKRIAINSVPRALGEFTTLPLILYPTEVFVFDPTNRVRCIAE